MREPIDSFNIDWDLSFADFAQAKLRQSDVAKPDGFLKSLFEWVESKRFIGAEFRELYKSELELTGDWRFERPLGRGAFGVVALFKHYRFGEIIDEVVVKDVVRKDHDHHDSKRSLSREAAVMAQTNDLGNENIIRLRNYKYFEDARQYRYFFENCEYGDLELLRLKYKAWQLHVPELFLWHLFSCFSSAHSAMTHGPFRSMSRRSFGKVHEDGYLIHCDIKTHNVFLGPPTKAKRDTRLYPSPKIADFGLATILTGPEDPSNRAVNMLDGTTRWKAPEVRVDQMGCPWQFAPTKSNLYADRSAHVITTETNLFPLAAIVWTFMTGREIDDLDQMVHASIKHHSPPKTPYVDPDIRPAGRTPADHYSSELRVLVRDCLKTLPSLRPTPEDLQKRIRNGMKRCLAREEAKNERNPNATAAPQKIYCVANGVNDVPQGKADFKLDKLFWQRFASATLFVPEDWGALLPPTAPQDWQPSTKWPPELRRRWMDNLKRARINKRRRGGGQEEPESVSKRARVREAFRNMKNAVPVFRRATTTARPTSRQQHRMRPAEFGMPSHVTTRALNMVKDRYPNKSQRPAREAFVNPVEHQPNQPIMVGQKRAFNDSTVDIAQHDRNLRPRSYTVPQPEPQSPAIQTFESANPWAARWQATPDDSEATFEAPMPPTPTRPQRRAHIKRDRAPSRLDRNRRS